MEELKVRDSRIWHRSRLQSYHLHTKFHWNPAISWRFVPPQNYKRPPLVDFHDIWYGGDAIQGDFDAIIFTPISSTVLKWLTFRVVSWGHDFHPCTAMVWDCLIIGVFRLHHIQSLANVTMATTARNLLQSENDIWTVMLPWQPELLITVMAKRPELLSGSWTSCSSSYRRKIWFVSLRGMRLPSKMIIWSWDNYSQLKGPGEEHVKTRFGYFSGRNF
jgi:hypothetical protein